MDVARKEQILEMVERALESTSFGKITIELRGPESSADVVVEQRTRFYVSKEEAPTTPTPKTRVGYKRG